MRKGTKSLKEGLYIDFETARYPDYVDMIYLNTGLSKKEVWELARDYWNREIQPAQVIKELRSQHPYGDPLWMLHDDEREPLRKPVITKAGRMGESLKKNRSLKESAEQLTATDVVTSLYDKFPEIEFYDEEDLPKNKVKLRFEVPAKMSSDKRKEVGAFLTAGGVDYRFGYDRLIVIAEEDDEYKLEKYNATSYFSKWRGVEDGFASDNLDELQDWCWEKVSNGVPVLVEDRDRAERLYLDPDELIDEYDDYASGKFEDAWNEFFSTGSFYSKNESLKESAERTDDLDTGIKDETETIDLYDDFMKKDCFDKTDKELIKGIRDDEKDHRRILRDMKAGKKNIKADESLQERNLTRAERANRNADRIFKDYHDRLERMKDFLRKNTEATEEEIKAASDNTGLHSSDKDLWELLKKYGVYDEFFAQDESLKESVSQADIDELESHIQELTKIYDKYKNQKVDPELLKNVKSQIDAIKGGVSILKGKLRKDESLKESQDEENWAVFATDQDTGKEYCAGVYNSHINALFWISEDKKADAEWGYGNFKYRVEKVPEYDYKMSQSNLEFTKLKLANYKKANKYTNESLKESDTPLGGETKITRELKNKVFDYLAPFSDYESDDELWNHGDDIANKFGIDWLTAEVLNREFIEKQLPKYRCESLKESKTTNEYWAFLEQLRRSGIVNMFGATPYLVREFGLDEKEARKILLDRMQNYNPDDYEESLKESRRVAPRKYRGCKIQDAGSTFVCTNENGLTIGQSRTEAGCEGIIDDYLDKKSSKQESLSEDCTGFDCFDNQFYTREDLNEIMSDVNDNLPAWVQITGIYADGMTLDLDIEVSEFGDDRVYIKTDMRKFKGGMNSGLERIKKQVEDEVLRKGKSDYSWADSDEGDRNIVDVISGLNNRQFDNLADHGAFIMAKEGLKENYTKKQESINIRESLNKMDLDTDNAYDLRNMYDSSILSNDQKIGIAKMISENKSPKELYGALKKLFEEK